MFMRRRIASTQGSEQGPRASAIRKAAGVILVAFVILGVPMRAAATAYVGNIGAVGTKGAIGNNWDGLAGFQMLTQLTAHTGYFIAHPGQINPSFSNDFIGFGTAKGVGVSNCPSYYGTSWQVYGDGSVLGVYFCDAYQYIAGGAQSQSFIVQRRYTPCEPGDTAAGWDVKWQGVVQSCLDEDFSKTDFVSAGAENGGNYPNQALAISYVQMQYRAVGSNYAYWGSYSPYEDSPYTITNFGTRTSYKIAP